MKICSLVLQELERKIKNGDILEAVENILVYLFLNLFYFFLLNLRRALKVLNLPS